MREYMGTLQNGAGIKKVAVFGNHKQCRAKREVLGQSCGSKGAWPDQPQSRSCIQPLTRSFTRKTPGALSHYAIEMSKLMKFSMASKQVANPVIPSKYTFVFLK